jgi:GAF domain-containing protein
MSGAGAALLWSPDTVHPIFLCIGASHGPMEKFLRRSAPRDAGYIGELVRDRQAIVLAGEELAAPDPFVRGVPPAYRACLAVPLEAEGIIVGLLALFFELSPNPEEALGRLERFLEQAAPALGRALRSERKTVGMLHAIERLTNLYDLSKAFGATIEIDELSTLVVRKAVDFAGAEVASL